MYDLMASDVVPTGSNPDFILIKPQNKFGRSRSLEVIWSIKQGQPHRDNFQAGCSGLTLSRF